MREVRSTIAHTYAVQRGRGYAFATADLGKLGISCMTLCKNTTKRNKAKGVCAWAERLMTCDGSETTPFNVKIAI